MVFRLEKIQPVTWFVAFLVYTMSILLLIFTAIGLGAGIPFVVINNWWNIIFAMTVMAFYTLFFLTNAFMRDAEGIDAPDIVDAGCIIGYVIFFVLTVMFLDVPLCALILSIDLVGFFFRFGIFTIAIIQAAAMIGYKA